ncbi:hypothetical protein AKJ16_DCAP03352 [Drosera capensis]
MASGSASCRLMGIRVCLNDPSDSSGARIGGEVRKSTNKRCIDVCGGLGLSEISSIISIDIILSRSSYNGSNKDIRVAASWLVDESTGGDLNVCSRRLRDKSAHEAIS